MKVAFFGYNFFSSCLDVFAQHGHEVIQLFTGPEIQYTDNIHQWAYEHHVPLYMGRPSDEIMDELLGKGVDLLFSAAYSWKITHTDQVPYAINLHSTLLPEGRGPCPLPHILQRAPQIAGLTLHQLAERIDEGDVILQKALPPEPEESLDMFATRLYLEAPKLLNTLLNNFDSLYHSRAPQTKGSYIRDINDQDRTLNWASSCHTLEKQIRAFNILGVFLEAQGEKWLAFYGETLVYSHDYQAGQIIQNNQQKLVIAVSDGLVLFPKQALSLLTNAR